MATTTVVISQVKDPATSTGKLAGIRDPLHVDGLSPSEHSVTIVAGDTVTFVADPDADSTLYFSPPTVGILTPTPVGTPVLYPAPNGTLVPLAGGASLTYTFGSPSDEAYGVLLMPGDMARDAFSGQGFEPPTGPPVLTIFGFHPPAGLKSFQPNEHERLDSLSFPGPVQPIKTG